MGVATGPTFSFGALVSDYTASPTGKVGVPGCPWAQVATTHPRIHKGSAQRAMIGGGEGPCQHSLAKVICLLDPREQKIPKALSGLWERSSQLLTN